jgi:predicted TIM-barrel fold metal-dependent hydrolase
MKYKTTKITTMTIYLLLLSCCTTQHITKKVPDNIISTNDIRIIDSHNHDAAKEKYKSTIKIWNKYNVDKIILFGNISEPAAIYTDKIAFSAYKKYPKRIIPFIAGINIFDQSCLDYITKKFEEGVCGIGEIVAASAYSPMTSKLPWKGKDSLDGFLPQIYDICGKYGKPILLHIDPPNEYQLQKLVDAAEKYQNTKFIFAHANAYTSPETLGHLISKTKNIYMDFFAGFTAFNKDSSFKLIDFVPLIEAYPERFIVSTDSGYAVGYENAYMAIFELLNLLKRETAIKLAHENIENILYKKQ